MVKGGGVTGSSAGGEAECTADMLMVSIGVFQWLGPPYLRLTTACCSTEREGALISPHHLVFQEAG